MAQNSSPIIPGKPIITGYPTPVLDDRIYRVRKDSRVADYVVPKPGTPFDGKREFEDKLEGFVFATAVPVADPSQAEMVDWYYLNKRANQDSYNFSIEYPYSDPDCPRLTRTYVYLRGSEPPPLLSDVDPIFTELKLIDQKQTRLQDPILDSIFTALERIYECLPSPAITAVSDRPESVLPFNMRTALPTTEESHTEQGAATAPTMSDTDWHKQEQQQTLFRKLVTSVKRVLPGSGITLNLGRRLTREQQVATVSSTWKAGGQTITPSATLIEATVDDIGNNTTVKEEVTVPSVFVEGVYDKEIPDIIPAEFRVAVPVVTSEETSAGTASTNPTLNTGDLRVRESQVTALKKRVLRATRAAISLPVSLTNKLTNAVKQVVTQIRTLQTSGTSTAVPSATQDVKVTQLGNNTELEEKETIPGVFDAKSRQIGTPIVIPERFRASTGVNTAEDTVAGTVPGTVALGAGEVERVERQETVFTKRVRTTSFDPATAPTLHGQDLDQKLNVITPYTETLEVSGTSLGDPGKEITPLSSTVDLVKEIDISAATAFFDSYGAVLPGRTRVEFPSVMTGFDILFSTHQGGGDSHTTYAAGTWSGSGSYSLPVHQETQASIVNIPEFVEFLAAEKGNHRYLKTKKVVFFLPSPVTESAVLSRLSTILGVSVTDWPNFNPIEVVAVLTGRQSSLRLTADYHYQNGGSSSGSESALVTAIGYSEEVGLTLKTTRVRPTIHGNLGTSSDFDTLSGGLLTATAATASISRFVPDANADWTVYNTGATPGDTSIPSSGTRLMRTDSELYKYGYVMIMCETLDFSQL